MAGRLDFAAGLLNFKGPHKRHRSIIRCDLKDNLPSWPMISAEAYVGAPVPCIKPATGIDILQSYDSSRMKQQLSHASTDCMTVAS